jgi:hypothetical protein
MLTWWDELYRVVEVGVDGYRVGEGERMASETNEVNSADGSIFCGTWTTSQQRVH